MRYVKVLLIVCGALVTLAGGVAVLYSAGRWTYGHIIESPTSGLYKKLAELSVGTTTGAFESQLGHPVVTDHLASYEEEIFLDKYFYVQVLADSVGRVAMYSVTTRRQDFHPKVPLLQSQLDTHGKQVQLGRTRFADLGRPLEVTGFYSLGSRFYGYSELFVTGDASVDPSVALSLTDSGVLRLKDHLLDILDRALVKIPEGAGTFVRGLRGDTLNDYLNTSEELANRHRVVVNTYTVMLPSVDFDLLARSNGIGVQKGTVQNLPGWLDPLAPSGSR